MSDHFSFVLLWLYLAQTKVNHVLVARVKEVAKEVSLDSEVAIVECSFGSSLACRSEVSLHGWSARVKDADCICIVGPLCAEDVLKCIWQSLEG